MTITWRVGKSRNLTPAEVDANFLELRTDLNKVRIPTNAETGDLLSVGAGGALEVVSLDDLVTYLSGLGFSIS